jgi:peptide/nickel transport system ATP-binding protein
MSRHPDNCLLSVDDLRLGFEGPSGITEVLHGISLSIRHGEIVALVGESGSGKSVTARVILGLLQEFSATRLSGSVHFDGMELVGAPNHVHRGLRGRDVSMIFQDPTNSLNPLFKIRTQFRAVLSRRRPGLSRRRSDELAAALLAQVQMDDPQRVLASYPFQLSGGMNQRVMIAMALGNQPKLLLADEPGTALDVTVQAQTLVLMRKLVSGHGGSMLFISHNLGVVREMADRIYVIHRGRIVEQGSKEELFRDPRHPYTRALLNAVPKITGGGIPKLPKSLDFSAPMATHDDVSQGGCRA